MIDRRTLLAGSIGAVGISKLQPGNQALGAVEPETFLVSSSGSNAVEFVDGSSGEYTSLPVGAAPWGITLGPGNTAFVATAEGVAEVDISDRQLRSLTPYQSWSGEITYGEYRPGGMGIAVAPDGSRTYTGVYLPDGTSLLEVMDVQSNRSEATVPVGLRPFQVLISGDGAYVYSIDHDSYSVTVIDTVSFDSVSRLVAPLGDANGLAGFEKPHYAALTSDDDLLLPFQGQALVRLNPLTGETHIQPLSANTHQHGIALSLDGSKAAIVGTGPAGGATEGPSVTILEIESGSEQIIPLDRQHEQVIWSRDGNGVILTGGYTFGGGGWNGLTLVDLETGTSTEWDLGSLPLDIVRLPPNSTAD